MRNLLTHCLVTGWLLVLGGFVLTGTVWGEEFSAASAVDSSAQVATDIVADQQAVPSGAPLQAAAVSLPGSPEELPSPAAETTISSEQAAEDSPPPAQEPSLYRLAVVGVRNETGEKEFSKLLIAQGVSQLVAQALFDTGRYVPVEDNPEITGRISELVALAAANGDQPLDYASLDRQALGCDAMASAVIKKFSKSRMRSFAGPFSAANVDIEIEVEVAVHEAGKPVMAASGSGTGTTKSRGVLFQIREDKVHFDQTSVGQATETAVHEAVTRLMAGKKEGG